MRSIPRIGGRLALVALSALAACGKGERDAVIVDGAPRKASSAATTGAGAPRPGCPRTGHWTACLAKVRLEQAGLAPRENASLDELPRLSVPPTVYGIGRNRVAIYLFATAAERERAAKGLDGSRFIAPSAALTMHGEATAIQNDNLLALLFSTNDQQRERVSDAFMAGAPQP